MLVHTYIYVHAYMHTCIHTYINRIMYSTSIFLNENKYFPGAVVHADGSAKGIAV